MGTIGSIQNYQMSCAILLFSAVPTLVASWSVSLKPSLPSPLGYMKDGDNFCVSDEGVDLVQLSMPDGNADRDSCAQACSLSNDCSAYEWYTDGWDGNHCFRILASPPAAAADGGSRWRDAECWVRPTLLPLCQDDDSGDSGFYDMYTCAQIAFWCGPDSPYDEFHRTGTANRCRLSCDPVCESLRP